MIMFLGSFSGLFLFFVQVIFGTYIRTSERTYVRTSDLHRKFESDTALHSSAGGTYVRTYVLKSALKEVLPRDLDRELATANWVDRELGRPGRPSSRERPTCRGGPNGLISPSSRCDADGLSRPWVVNMMVDGGKLVNQPGKSFV